jgi:glucose/arabinose dehydrogenase
MAARSALLALGAGAVLGLGSGGAAPAAAQSQATATLVASGLSRPLFVAAPNGSPRLFVVERAGRIRIVQGGVTLPALFLDISARISAAGEGGLLGLAFAPDYGSSGLFYVYYTDLLSDSVVARYSVSASPDLADPDSEQILLFIDQPDGMSFLNHKGGTIAFGPDGFLWFATGDGGGANDPEERAQDPQSLLGKMLRIDVGPAFAPDSLPVDGELYRIPTDNPFVGSAARDEIWALGLRNPFRWSFDRETGDVWIGDVGQGAREEVDFEPAGDPGGRNYGWDVMEGTLCNGSDPAPAPPCNAPSLTLPVHASSPRCSSRRERRRSPPSARPTWRRSSRRTAGPTASSTPGSPSTGASRASCAGASPRTPSTRAARPRCRVSRTTGGASPDARPRPPSPGWATRRSRCTTTTTCS